MSTDRHSHTGTDLVLEVAPPEVGHLKKINMYLHTHFRVSFEASDVFRLPISGGATFGTRSVCLSFVFSES